MKFLIVLALAAGLYSAPSYAIPNAAVSARILFSQDALESATYTTLVASLAKAVKGISVYHTGVNPVRLAIGASLSEQDQLIIAPIATAVPGLSAAVMASAQPQYFSIPLSQGTRVSLKALNSDETAGEIQVNFLYY